MEGQDMRTTPPTPPPTLQHHCHTGKQHNMAGFCVNKANTGACLFKTEPLLKEHNLLFHWLPPRTTWLLVRVASQWLNGKGRACCCSIATKVTAETSA